MKKFGIQLVFLVILIFFASQFAFNQTFGGLFDPVNRVSRLQVGEKTLQVEVADTAEKRKIGLSNREEIATDSGLLFVFDKSEKHKFWMKGMNFPIDILWIQDGKVVEIATRVPNPGPETPDEELKIYEPYNDSDQVLEVRSGFVEENNIKINDEVILN